MTFTLKNIFGPCSRYQTESEEGLAELSVKAFRQSFYNKFNKSLLKVILEQILRDRIGEDVNVQLLKDTIRAIFINNGYERNIKITKDSVTKEIMLTGTKSMKSYEEDFEKALIEDTTDFYQKRSAEWRNQSANYFVMQSHKFLKKEEDMADAMFEASSKPKILDVFYNTVIIKNAQALVDQEQTGCRFMFDNQKNDQLGSMFQLFSRIPDS